MEDMTSMTVDSVAAPAAVTEVGEVVDIQMIVATVADMVVQSIVMIVVMPMALVEAVEDIVEDMDGPTIKENRRRIDDHDPRSGTSKGGSRGHDDGKGRSGRGEGVIDENGVEAFYKKSFVEDPWADLEVKEIQNVI
ncbi:hypothetical protein HK104_010881 [Borealophlyctis nickersoniae]|nr:hypothetical protein HK104_010881 [Borealophlyctis nickersoniae]